MKTLVTAGALLGVMALGLTQFAQAAQVQTKSVMNVPPVAAQVQTKSPVISALTIVEMAVYTAFPGVISVTPLTGGPGSVCTDKRGLPIKCHAVFSAF